MCCSRLMHVCKTLRLSQHLILLKLPWLRCACKCNVQVVESKTESGSDMTLDPSTEIPWDINGSQTDNQPAQSLLWVTTEFDPNDKGWTRPGKYDTSRYLPRRDGMLCCSIPKPANASGDVRYW